jgi:hypothetical protein
MSQFGQKVVAVIDTQSAFGVTVKTLKENVDTLTGQMSTLLADAPDTLDTLNEIAAAISDDPAFFTTMASANTTLQANIDALSTAAATARTALQTALQANIDAEALTGTNARGVLSGRLDTLELDSVTKTYVDAAVTNLIDAAPGVLDTLNEIAAALGDDENFATTVTNNIATVQADVDANEADRKTYFKWDSNLTKVVNPLRNSEIEVGNNIHIDPAAGYATQFDGNVEFDNNTVLSHGGVDLTATFTEINAFDGRLDTLEADPTTAAAVATVQADVDANEAASDAAETALSGRLDTLEADPTTATAVAAVQTDVDANQVTAANAVTAQNTAMLAAVAVVQADVDQNETDADAAIAAVQADVNQNETDADAAIAAVQADVDQNESDADTAIALKADTAGDTFTGDILLKNPSGNAVSLRLSRADHPDMSCEWKISPSYVSSSKECLSVLAAGQPVAHFDERQRVSINKTDPDYTLDVAGDGKFSTDLTIGGTLTIGSTAITATGAELNYVDGVTSNIQTQLDATVSAADTTLTGLTTMASAKFSTVLPEYSNDSSAASGGVPVGGLYRTMQLVKIRVS